MSGWDQLRTELDLWQAEGGVATAWWRDDDAVTVTAELETILAFEQDYKVPLALAVIPALLEDALVERLVETVDTRVLQHGWSHQNHMPEGCKKQELDDVRDIGAVVADLRQGFHVLETRFGSRFLPVVVPPWNRIASDVVASLHSLGFRGLSTFNARKTAEPFEGLLQVNTHVDVIDWRGTRGFVGEDVALAMMVNHLKARRTGQVDRDEPTGILTHHLVHDEPTTKFLDNLFSMEHAALSWLRIPGVFPWQ
ncbi:polysaccharide deacetylase family protein [Thalassospira sp. SM2505]|uniref:polysaccharide deacetylase family protein n=1 Tax=Thalassospira sp. CH_XMU1448-2 TaxID=3107773 RepID=UPI0030090E17